MGLQPFLAMIIPVTQPPEPGQPPGIWGGSNEPFPGWGLPPAGPGRPPGIWGGGNQPFPTPPIPIYPGGSPNPPGSGGSPPGIWGGSNEPFPGWGLPPAGPGRPPGFWGGSSATFPGYWVPGAPGAPGYQPPAGTPPGFWGGGNVPMPTPPIQLPPWEWTGGRPPGTWGGSGEPFPGWGLPPGLELPEVPDGIVPPGMALVIVYVPGEGLKATLIPKPGPGYNPPSGGDTPQPVEDGKKKGLFG